MVIEESNSGAAASNLPHFQPVGPHQATIDNIMSGIENTGAVKMNNHRKKLRQRFDIIKKLGQGTYGKVQLGINKETGQEVAIKTIKKSKIETEADLIRIRREVQIMSSVQHPNIIHIYEVFENREKMVLVMEFAAGGELYDYLSERKVLTEEEARRIFRQISTAIYYCHKHKICHRDLKLENILLDENGNAKIADFGLSNVFDEQRLLATFCGSPLYASPEIVKGTPYQGPEVDCWSLGVLLYTLVYGAMPFDGANFKRLVKQISAGDYFEPKKPSRASPLIREMLTACPQKRANIEQICNHWWVNEGYGESCLELAEDLANQTPVRLDVLLSLSPPSITADQLVVPNVEDEKKSCERIVRSHSVGSVMDLQDVPGNTEAERRILDMVAAGGEQALMPSQTRIITPSESPVQPKRKLEPTVSTENAAGLTKKKERPTEKLKIDPSKSIAEINNVPMDVDPTAGSPTKEEKTSPKVDPTTALEQIGNICDELLQSTTKTATKTKLASPAPMAVAPRTLPPPEKSQEKPVFVDKIPVKKPFNKGKTVDLSATIDKMMAKEERERAAAVGGPKTANERKNSLPEEKLSKPTERRKSKILETAEKFQNMNNQNNEKYKKFVIPGVSVGNFKREFERKASLTSSINLGSPTNEKKPFVDKNKENVDEKIKEIKKTTTANKMAQPSQINKTYNEITPVEQKIINKEVEPEMNLKETDSKSSVGSFSLEEARRSMENSIALLNQVKHEETPSKSPAQATASTAAPMKPDVDQLCAKAEKVTALDDDRERKLKNAREIIGNAIPKGIRKPPLAFGANGRSMSQNVGGLSNERKTMRLQVSADPKDIRTANFSISTPEQKLFSREPFSPTNKSFDQKPFDENATKTSRAEITLKSATLPRRKTVKSEIQLDIKPKLENPMRFSTEMQHQMPDLRSAPIREHPAPYSPIKEQRANSLEPASKPPTYKNSLQGTRRDILSRQSTNESNDSDNTLSQSQTQITSGSATAPIKKSPREFIIPIAVEGGGYVTPRATSLEPSESANTSENLSSFGSKKKLSRPKRMGSLFSEKGSEEDLTSPFQRLNRHTSLGRDSDSEEPRFHTMHRLRSSRPSKRSTSGTQVEKNDSASSGEDDDEDAFEILTAENLFSTLLSRVRALTNRVNESNNEFPSSRLLRDFQQTHSPFWNNDPFNRRHNGIGSNLNSSPTAWRHSATRNLGSDFDSMFSRSGATLPRGRKQKSTYPNGNSNSTNEQKSSTKSKHNNTNKSLINDNGDIDILDLGDLDLSQLRLTKKDLETLSTITPSLSKKIQEQLLAQLPPNQARKLSRTLSMQNNQPQVSKDFLRSHSTGGDVQDKRGSTEYSYDRDENHYTSGSVTPTNENEPLCKFEKEFYNRANRPSEERSYRARSQSGVNCSASPPPLPPCYYESRCLSPIKDGSNSLPHNGYVSPPPLPHDVAARRKSLNRRISKFLRPDFYDNPISDPGPNILEREKFNRECETQKILREIREKSRERSVDLQLAKPNNDDIQRHIGRHRSMSRSKEIANTENINLKPIKDKILDELNNLSILQIDDAVPTSDDAKNKTASKFKEKLKKVKVKHPKSEAVSNENLEILPKPIKKESKIQRPKSYPIKATENISVLNSTAEEVKIDSDQLVSANNSKISRPKSFPHSKITPPKDAKKITESPQIPSSGKEHKREVDVINPKPSGSKIAKKSTTKSKVAKETSTQEENGPKLEGSPEKKLNKGFLYSIGQKFEKLRDATKSKEKKSSSEPFVTETQPNTVKITKVLSKPEVKKKETVEAENNEEKAKIDRISKIDAMIRNLRDRSVPRGPEITESGLIKRAVSVEEMPGTFNKCTVNKVLGLFKKIEKDNVDKSKKVQNAKSTSYIGGTNIHNSGHKERPKSSNFSNRHEEFSALATTSKLTAIPLKSSHQKSDSSINDSVEDCDGDENYANVSKRHSRQSVEKERLKNNRKALLLDFSQINENKIQNYDSNYNMIDQGVNKTNNNSNTELSNRQPYHHHHHHHLVNNTNNNSMSTSTFESFNNSFRSPDDEPHSSAFDSSESYLSDDHISPSVSRKSSHHYIHTPSFVPVNDTVNDRIRRMSFYSRYNENKPRRISHIVGPAAKDYYSLDREPSEPAVSNRLSSSRHHHEYSRSLTSNIPEPLKTLPHSYYRPKYPLTNDYSKRRSSNLVVPTSSHVQLTSPITMYATMSRKIQPYSHRSISMLDSSSSFMNPLIREHTPRASTTENGFLTRSSVRSRHPSQSPAD